MDLRKIIPVLLGIMLMLIISPGLALGSTIDIYPEHLAWLLLSTGEVDLGLPVPDPSGHGDCWELRNALYIMFQCLQPREKWQVSLNGSDFVSGKYSIKRNRMELKIGEGSYQSLKPAGHELVLARSEDFPGNDITLHILRLSFRLLLSKWEPSGEYAGEMNVTVFFW